MTFRAALRVFSSWCIGHNINAPDGTFPAAHDTDIAPESEGIPAQQVQLFARHRQVGTTPYYAHNLELSRNPCSRLIMEMIGG